MLVLFVSLACVSDILLQVLSMNAMAGTGLRKGKGEGLRKFSLKSELRL